MRKWVNEGWSGLAARGRFSTLPASQQAGSPRSCAEQLQKIKARQCELPGLSFFLTI
jgi:hypothetical protein